MKGRRGVVVAAVLVGALFASWAFSTEGSPGAGLSTYESGPDGGKALHEAYRAAGRPTTRIRSALTGERLSVLGAGTTLFVMAPRDVPSRDEARAVRDWVEAGGSVVLVLGGTSDGALLGQLAPGVSQSHEATGPITPAGPAPEAAGWRRLEQTGTSLRLPTDAQPVAGGEGGVAVAAVARGSGRVVVIADGAMVTARHLRRHDGVAFAMALARGAVAFDEFHHGFEDPVGGDVDERANLVALQLLAVTGVIFLARGRRRAPARMETEERPLSRAAFAEALAESLRGADGRDAALDVMRTDLRRLLRSRTLAPPDAPDEELVRRAQAAGIDAREALLGTAPDERSFLLRSRQVAGLIEELGGVRS